MAQDRRPREVEWGGFTFVIQPRPTRREAAIGLVKFVGFMVGLLALAALMMALGIVLEIPLDPPPPPGVP